MTDIYNTVKTFLAADPGVAALVSTRIYIDVALPTSYQISDGDILVIRPNGGTDIAYAMTTDNIMFLCYSQTAQGAINISEAVFDAMKRTYNPAEATAFWSKPIDRGSLIKQPGDLYTMLMTYTVAEVI